MIVYTNKYVGLVFVAVYMYVTAMCMYVFACVCDMDGLFINGDRKVTPYFSQVLDDPFLCQNPRRSLCVSFSRTDSRLCIYISHSFSLFCGQPEQQKQQFCKFSFFVDYY